MALMPSEYYGGDTVTLIKSTSATTPQSFSDKDISEYDGFVLSIGANASSVHGSCYIPKSMIAVFNIFRVPLIASTLSTVGYAEVDFSAKTIQSTSNTYYATLYGVKN